MTKIILDVDTGIDDALAIAYAAGSPDAELIAVTCSFGNVRVEKAVENTLAVLHLLGRDDIPVYPGKNETFADGEPFVPNPVCKRVHGENGIGGIDPGMPDREPESMDAAAFMAESARAYGKDLLIVATAAMTNLARFIRDYPVEAGMVGNIAFMGGALTVPGNVNPFGEANMLADPEAARFVFESGRHLLMIGLDVTLKTNRTAREMEESLRSWRETGTRAGKLFGEMIHYYCSNEQGKEGETEGAIHDPLAVAAALHPELVTTACFNLTVETEGPSRGRTIGDLRRLRDAERTVEVCLDVDVEAFMEDFIKTCERVLRG